MFHQLFNENQWQMNFKWWIKRNKTNLEDRWLKIEQPAYDYVHFVYLLSIEERDSLCCWLCKYYDYMYQSAVSVFFLTEYNMATGVSNENILSALGKVNRKFYLT